MNRTKAWKAVAEAFDTPFGFRTAIQRDWTQFGLCYAMKWAVLDGDNSIYPTIKELGFPFEELPYGDGDEFRATFAGLMAAMTQRERDRLVKGL